MFIFKMTNLITNSLKNLMSSLFRLETLLKIHNPSEIDSKKNLIKALEKIKNVRLFIYSF